MNIDYFSIAWFEMNFIHYGIIITKYVFIHAQINNRAYWRVRV